MRITAVLYSDGHPTKKHNIAKHS